MTNNQHGQVPEALIDLIDAYAETRHRYGRIHNARTEAARKAVIEALSGVQALSAAPAGWKLVPVEPTRSMMASVVIFVNGNEVYKNVSATALEIEESIYGEAYSAMLAASPTPPAPAEQQAAPKAAPATPTAEQPIGEVVVTKDEDGQIVAVTRQDDEGRILSVIATSGPAEQQAAPKAAPGDRPISSASAKAAAHVAREFREAAPQQEAQEPMAYVHVPHYTVEGKVRPVVSFEKYQQDYDDGIYSTRIPLYAAPQPAPAPLSEMPYEKRKAIQEGEQIGASDAWFHARHNMLDTLDRRNVFRAGFDRGWNAALAAQGGKA